MLLLYFGNQRWWAAVAAPALLAGAWGAVRIGHRIADGEPRARRTRGWTPRTFRPISLAPPFLLVAVITTSTAVLVVLTIDSYTITDPTPGPTPVDLPVVRAAAADYDDVARTWQVTERMTVADEQAENVAEELGVSSVSLVKLLATSLVDEGWAVDSTQPADGNRWFRLRSVPFPRTERFRAFVIQTLPFASVRVWFSSEAEVVLVPDEGSAVALRAPCRALAGTRPASEVAECFDGMEERVVETVSRFEVTEEVDVRLAASWLRSDPGHTLISTLDQDLVAYTIGGAVLLLLSPKDWFSKAIALIRRVFGRRGAGPQEERVGDAQSRNRSSSR